MTKIKHSKFKNTGILFELLARQVTADIIRGNDESKANKILHKFFNESTELGKELTLYQLLMRQKAKDSVSADRIIESILEARKRISPKALHEQKYNLIKEIKDSYPLDDFLRGQLSNYKLMASIYKLFENHISDQYYNANEVLQSRECISEGLLGGNQLKSVDEKDKIIESYKKQDADLRILSYKMLVDKFNEKYSDLNESQKKLLKEYICNVSNTNSFKAFIDSEIPTIQDKIKTHINEIKDKVVQVKLQETNTQLDKIKKGRLAKDSHVSVMLLSYELIKQLEAM